MTRTTARYARLMRALAVPSDDRQLRLHCIKAMRSLAATDLALLVAIVDAAGATTEILESEQQHRVDRALKGVGALHGVSIAALERWGFASSSSRAGIPWPTSLGIDLARVLRAGEWTRT